MKLRFLQNTILSIALIASSTCINAQQQHCGLFIVIGDPSVRMFSTRPELAAEAGIYFASAYGLDIISETLKENKHGLSSAICRLLSCCCCLRAAYKSAQFVFY